MEKNNNNVDDKLIIEMALLAKAMEQLDSILKDDNSQRVAHWKNNIYTVNEDIQDYLSQKNN